MILPNFAFALLLLVLGGSLPLAMGAKLDLSNINEAYDFRQELILTQTEHAAGLKKSMNAWNFGKRLGIAKIPKSEIAVMNQRLKDMLAVHKEADGRRKKLVDTQTEMKSQLQAGRTEALNLNSRGHYLREPLRDRSDDEKKAMEEGRVTEFGKNGDSKNNQESANRDLNAKLKAQDKLCEDAREGLKHSSERIVVKQLEIKQVGLNNLRADKVRGVFALVGVGAAVVVGLYFVLDKYTTLFHHETVAPLQRQIAVAIQQGMTSDEIFKGKCMEMHASVAKIEGFAQESIHPHVWDSYMKIMAPLHHDAHEQMSAIGIKNINEREIVTWGDSTPAPIDVMIPVDASAEDHQRMTLANAQARDHWSFANYVRPIQQQFQLTEEHREWLDTGALAIIRSSNSTEFPFETDSDHFNQVYAAFSGRLGIPSKCLTFFKEGEVTKHQLKEPRMAQSIREENTIIAFDSYFEARSNLSETAPRPTNQTLPATR